MVVDPLVVVVVVAGQLVVAVAVVVVVVAVVAALADLVVGLALPASVVQTRPLLLARLP